MVIKKMQVDFVKNHLHFSPMMQLLILEITITYAELLEMLSKELSFAEILLFKHLFRDVGGNVPLEDDVVVHNLDADVWDTVFLKILERLAVEVYEVG